MDEYQNQVCKSLVEAHYFDSEEEAKEFLKEQSGEKRWSDVSHIDDQYVVGYSRVGELMALGIKEAAKYYGMRVEFDGDYQIGFSWKETH